jgi:Ca2+:H+ antiporter
METVSTAEPATLKRPFGLPLWSVIAPFAALAGLVLGQPTTLGPALLIGFLLAAAIMAAVYQAEVLAHYLGEPFGTLVLALAVTVIEVSLIVSIMLSEGAQAQALARDTLIAAIMITINGFIGLCLIAGGRRYLELSYTQSGVSAGLAMLATLSVLTLVLPNYTTSAPGAFYSDQQLIFVAVVSLVIYATFVGAQTIRHRNYFLHQVEGGGVDHAHEAEVTRTKAIAAAVMLLVALVGVVFLAKGLSPMIEAGVAALGAPRALVGIIIAALVLAPEGFAAVRAAREPGPDQPQPGDLVGAGDDRADHPGGGDRRAAARARPRTRPVDAHHRVAGADPPGGDADAEPRSRDADPGDHPSGDLRHLPVHDGGAVILRRMGQSTIRA